MISPGIVGSSAPSVVADVIDRFGKVTNVPAGPSRRRLVMATSAMLGMPAILRPSRSAASQAPQLRRATQFGVIYLPLLVMQEQRLIEAAARAAHPPVPQVSWRQFSGGVATNDALISGGRDFGAAHVPPSLIAWDHSRRNLRIKAVAALASVPSDPVTNRWGATTIRDFIAAEPHSAAQLYIKAQRSNLSVDFIERLLRDPRIRYTTTPQSDGLGEVPVPHWSNRHAPHVMAGRVLS